MVAVDLVRFGTFRHANQSDMWNDKFKPYVPTAAKNIVIYKHYGGNGFRAKYAISEAEFHAHVNDVWEKWREYHPGELENREDDGRPADSHTFHIYFGDLGWDKWGAVRSYRGPYGRNGAGTTYYFDRNAEIAYQRTGFW